MSPRILHVIESCNAGGIETTFLNMLHAFRQIDRRVEHHVLAFQDGALSSRFREVATALTIANDTATVDAVVARGCDLVHVIFERCAYRLLPRLLARTTVPVVYGKGYDMGGMYRLNEGLRWQADESMLVAVDGATFTTDALAAGYSLPPGRSTILRKAADTRRFAHLRPPTATTPARIVSVANIHPRKRLGDLLVAFSRVLDHVPHAQLRIVGGGDPVERTRLDLLIEALGLPAHVSFAGPSANVAAELAAARVFALSSSCEGVPTAALEAMAAGRPVVATRVGHIDTVIDDGREGYLVSVGDITALAQRLTDVLANPVHALEMGQRARRRAAQHAVQVVAAELFAALRQAMDGSLRQLSISSAARLAG